MEPHFRYCCPVWGVSRINAITKLQKLQNRAPRIVKSNAYNAAALPIIRKFDWPTINELIESETLKMVYKSLNEQAPTYLTEMFARLSGLSKRELRNTKTDMAAPHRKSAFGQECFSYKAAKTVEGSLNRNKITQNLCTIQNNVQATSMVIVNSISHAMVSVILICL